MKLGMKKDEVRLVPHDRGWKREFERTKENLLEHTNLQPHQIEHIGSTSIEGIVAKPIIDLAVGVENLEALDKLFFKTLGKQVFTACKLNGRMKLFARNLRMRHLKRKPTLFILSNCMVGSGVK